MAHQKTCALVLLIAAATQAGCGRSEAPVSFGNDVMPILQRHCLECHQPGADAYAQSGLGVESYAAVMKGTSFGPVVIPGDAFNSNLMVLVEGRADPAIAMPHDKDKLYQAELDTLRAWIEQGAPDN